MSKFMFESNKTVRKSIFADFLFPARAAKHGSIVSQMSRRPGAIGVRFNRKCNYA
jgi:UPF0288 family protein (methanogenesis marker protein 3)